MKTLNESLTEEFYKLLYELEKESKDHDIDYDILMKIYKLLLTQKEQKNTTEDEAARTIVNTIIRTEFK